MAENHKMAKNLKISKKIRTTKTLLYLYLSPLYWPYQSRHSPTSPFLSPLPPSSPSAWPLPNSDSVATVDSTRKQVLSRPNPANYCFSDPNVRWLCWFLKRNSVTSYRSCSARCRSGITRWWICCGEGPRTINWMDARKVACFLGGGFSGWWSLGCRGTRWLELVRGRSCLVGKWWKYWLKK